MKIRTGDTVVVISGKDKGKTGQVLRVLESKHKVVVADINMRTKHVKSTPQRPGQIVKYEASIDVSNVMVVDSKTKKRTRVGFKFDDKGKKQRIAKKSGETVKASAPSKAKKEKEQEKGSGSGESGVGEKKEKSTQEKGPFWKKMGFGADVIEEVGEQAVEGSGKRQEDQSVPDQTQRSTNRSSQRGS